MDCQNLCKSLIEAALPVAKSIAAPIAYLEISVSSDLKDRIESITECFKKSKWDTELSSADLMVQEDAQLPDSTIKIVQLVEFEDDSRRSSVHQMDKIISF
ncbi:MAG: hypothetical protein K6B73_08720 [Treponema sp.]|nr:hypothetical protein [Treponema sp.]